MLTQKARYAIHAMLYLARKADGGEVPEAVTVAEIAEAQKIPRKFLEHVLASLKNRDLVVGKRGPNGGYLLARPADRISFADILRCIDGPLALAPCASLTSYHPCEDCESVETCSIRPVLLAVRDTTALLLEGTSLAEAIGKKRISFI